MFLTKDEFTILKGIKEGLSYGEIAKKYNLKIYTSDPKVIALYQKYGALDRTQLMQYADLNKIEVIEADKMPYYSYEGENLVKKLKITYDDFKALQNFFSKEKNPENKSYEIVSSDLGIGSTLTIRESETKTLF